MIPGPAPLHHMSPTWSPGPLGFLGPGDSDLQKQSRAHSNTNPRWFPWQKSHDFWCWDKGDWLEALPYLGFLTSITWKFRKRNPEIAKLTNFGQVKYIFLRNSIFSANCLEVFLEFWTPIWFSGCGKSDNNCCVLCTGHWGSWWWGGVSREVGKWMSLMAA